MAGPTIGTVNAWPGFQGQILFTNPSGGNSIIPAAGLRVRASSIGLQVKQDIQYPDLCDGAVDKSAYALQGEMAEGDIAFPMIHEGAVLSSILGTPKNGGAGCGNSYTSSLAEAIWQLAVGRDPYGRMLTTFDAQVQYPDNSNFIYGGCLVNTLGIKVTQGAPVEFTMGLMGGANGAAPRSNATAAFAAAPVYLAPARIVTWNDVQLALYSTATTSNDPFNGTVLNGTGIRELSIDVKNNCERYFTLNGSLGPQDITARKREISGSFKILGRSQYLNTVGSTNYKRFTSNEHLAFGYSLGNAGNIYWATVLHGCIFKYEELTINPSEVFESSVAFNAAGDCGYSYEATEASKNLGTQTLPTTGAAGAYGGPTRVDSSATLGSATSATFGSALFSGW